MYYKRVSSAIHSMGDARAVRSSGGRDGAEGAQLMRCVLR